MTDHQTDPAAVDDDTARVAVTRLSRPDRSGRIVIERAAILAEGTDSTRILAWVVANGGQPEAAVAPMRQGLHSRGLDDSLAANRPPLRYVLPAAALA
jgi:hypothetical protein